MIGGFRFKHVERRMAKDSRNARNTELGYNSDNPKCKATYSWSRTLLLTGVNGKNSIFFFLKFIVYDPTANSIILHDFKRAAKL